MRVRQLSPTGDYTFGRGAGEFLVDTPAAVAQAVKTRLMLFEGEWFLDTTEGTPYYQSIFGKQQVPSSYDQAIKDRILGTPGVTQIVTYSSTLDAATRALSVEATINTLYGTATSGVTFNVK